MTDADIKVFLGEQEDIKGCHVDLRISGEALSVAEVSQALGTTPTRAFEKGEQYVSKGGGILVRPIGVWHLSTKDHPSKSMESHCQLLIDLLSHKEEVLRSLSAHRGYRVSISFWWDSGGPGHGGFNVLSETMMRICVFCNDVEFQFL